MLAFKSVDAASFVYISVVAMWVVMLFALVLAFSMTGATEELAEHYSLYLVCAAVHCSSLPRPFSVPLP
jgi:hypothetical protein